MYRVASRLGAQCAHSAIAPSLRLPGQVAALKQNQRCPADGGARAVHGGSASWPLHRSLQGAPGPGRAQRREGPRYGEAEERCRACEARQGTPPAGVYDQLVMRDWSRWGHGRGRGRGDGRKRADAVIGRRGVPE